MNPENSAIFWMRRDLRLNDNHGLYEALKENENVIILFIFDKHILDDLENKKDKRLIFIHQQLLKINQCLSKIGSGILTFYGTPEEFFKNNKVKSVYTNNDYEPYAIERDEKVRLILSENNSTFYSFKDQVIFEKAEVVKNDGSPYTVFTPYSRKWKEKYFAEVPKSFPSEELLHKLKKGKFNSIIELNEMGFQDQESEFPSSNADISIISEYANNRDYPSKNGTSRLSVHLRFGTLSIRELSRIAYENSQVWLNELIWRNFYMSILWHFPHVVNNSFKPKYDKIIWRNNEKEFHAWCQGKTGYPIVDAGMRELNSTGFMHNRVRMITASFLTKHLLIDWRWGEAYFAEKLLDFELASNNGGWQWAAGSGCDAAPYFRVFNPELQTKKFDPDLKYIKKWVPEFQELTYPKPIVEHKFARERVLKTYKEALN